MAATNEQLEERLARLEREVQELRSGQQHPTDEPRWKRIAGSAVRDDVYAEITRLGAEIRRQEREDEQ